MTAHQAVPVTEASQVSAARYVAHGLATTAQFSADDVHRAGIVATELATNLLKHTPGGGELLMRATPDDGVEIISVDRGPGLGDSVLAHADGFSTSGTLGGGLGAVSRMSDGCDFYTRPGQGTVMAAWLKRQRRSPESTPAFLVGGVSVPAHGEQICGDAWMVWSERDGVTIALADGLGHGPDASKASALAMEIFDRDPRQRGVDAMKIVHAALRPTRGAAGAWVRVEARGTALAFVGVGNISGVITGAEAARHCVSHGGTLGHEARTFREYSYPWKGAGSVAVFFSDGLTSHWGFDTYPGLREHSPPVIASVLYRDFTRGRDDVTVVVLKERR